jgi:hypothetical protein
MSLFRKFMGIHGSKQSPIVPGLGQGRAALKVTPSLQDCGHLLRGQAPAWIIGKEHPLKHLPSSVQKEISISFNRSTSSRIDAHYCSALKKQ